MPPPGDLPTPGIKPRFPTLQADSLLTDPPGKPSDSLLFAILILAFECHTPVSHSLQPYGL